MSTTTEISTEAALTVTASALEKSDRAILRRVSAEAYVVAITRASLIRKTDPFMISSASQRLAIASAKLEIAVDIARSTGAAARNEALFVAALDGNDDDLY